MQNPMENRSLESALVMQFAKWPEAGRVKTRLMPLLGEQGALEAHITLSLAVLNQARHLVFLVSGQGKAALVKDLLQEPAGPLPAA